MLARAGMAFCGVVAALSMVVSLRIRRDIALLAGEMVSVWYGVFLGVRLYICCSRRCGGCSEEVGAEEAC